MKDIYERADHIIAWLGPENQNSGSVALFTVANIYEHYTRLIDKLGTQEAAFKHMLDHKSWAGEEHAQAAYQQWWAVNQLFNRTWFHRIWYVTMRYTKHLFSSSNGAFSAHPTHYHIIGSIVNCLGSDLAQKQDAVLFLSCCLRSSLTIPLYIGLYKR
jgi:hypothetical protein